MDIYKIDKTTFLPGLEVVEGYTSCVWTERYFGIDEFQIKTPLVGETMNLIPETSLICEKDSDEIMMVETHSIGVDEDGAPELTTVGRSLKAFLDNRCLTGPYQQPWQMQQQYTAQDALMVLIWNSIVNPTAVDVTRPYAWDHRSRDNIANVIVTDSIKIQVPLAVPKDITDLQAVNDWALQTGSIFPKVNEILAIGDIGLRIVRPRPGQRPDAKKITVNPDGTFTKTTGPTSALRFDVYNGRNRTLEPSALDPLPATVFRYDAGHVESPNYLFSVKDYKNVVHWQTSLGTVEVLIAPSPEGLDLYMEWVDGGQLDNSVDPADFNLLMQQQARARYKQRRHLKMMDGSISAFAPYSYGTDYFLGDKVTVIGQYGVTGTMQISEYIRTEDKDGERSYPSLIVPD